MIAPLKARNAEIFFHDNVIILFLDNNYSDVNYGLFWGRHILLCKKNPLMMDMIILISVS